MTGPDPQDLGACRFAGSGQVLVVHPNRAVSVDRERDEMPEPLIVWTRQHRFLWTGRRNGMPAGTIEQGAHYTYVDISNSQYHGFRSLQEAQNAAEQLAPEPTLGR